MKFYKVFFTLLILNRLLVNCQITDFSRKSVYDHLIALIRRFKTSFYFLNNSHAGSYIADKECFNSSVASSICISVSLLMVKNVPHARHWGVM